MGDQKGATLGIATEIFIIEMKNQIFDDVKVTKGSDGKLVITCETSISSLEDKVKNWFGKYDRDNIEVVVKITPEPESLTHFDFGV